MHLADAFIQSHLQSIQAIIFFYQYYITLQMQFLLHICNAKLHFVDTDFHWIGNSLIVSYCSKIIYWLDLKKDVKYILGASPLCVIIIIDKIPSYKKGHHIAHP